MTPFQEIVLALLIAILAKTFTPSLGSDHPSNKAAIAVTLAACGVWIGIEAARWIG